MDSQTIPKKHNTVPSRFTRDKKWGQRGREYVHDLEADSREIRDDREILAGGARQHLGL